VIKELPRFNIVGPYRGMETQALADLAYMDKRFTVDRYNAQIPVTPERIAQIRSINHATEQFLLDIGVQLPQDRIPEASRFHYFNTASEMRSAAGYSDEDARYSKSHGICDYHNILVTETGDDSTVLTSQHEAIHFMAHQAWGLVPIQTKRLFGLVRNIIYAPSQVRSGYLHATHNPDNPTRFELLQELFIEITNIYIKQNYWPNYDNLPTSNVFVPGYFTLLVIGEEMLNATAKRLGMNTKDVFLPIAKGLFTGEMNGLRLLNQGLGTDAFRAAVHAGPLDVSPDLVLKMGVPEANKRVSQAYAAPNESTEIFGWM